MLFTYVTLIFLNVYQLIVTPLNRIQILHHGLSDDWLVWSHPSTLSSWFLVLFAFYQLLSFPWHGLPHLLSLWRFHLLTHVLSDSLLQCQPLLFSTTASSFPSWHGKPEIICLCLFYSLEGKDLRAGHMLFTAGPQSPELWIFMEWENKQWSIPSSFLSSLLSQ